MFNASGDQMDVTSPVRPDNNNQNQNTLPAFLLGTDSNYNQDNKNYFNNTPLKGRNPNQLSNNPIQPTNNSDIENRPPALLFSSKYGQSSRNNLIGQNIGLNSQNKAQNNRPFSNTQNVAKTTSTGPPTASLGEGFRNYNTESLGVKLTPNVPSYNVMASSPLPEKVGHLPRITTPDFSSSHIDNSPITSPITKQNNQNNPSQGTPLSRQVLEKRHLKSQNHPISQESENSVHFSINTSFPPEEEIDCWVSLFGFNSRNREKIIKYLTACGSIVCRQPSKKQSANWIHLRFASMNQAKRARQRFNNHVLESECAVIGVVECLEPGYILDYIKGCGRGDVSNVTCNDMDVSKVGMRSLVEVKGSVGNVGNGKVDEEDPFNIPQQESNSVVRRTLTYLLPSYF